MWDLNKSYKKTGFIQKNKNIAYILAEEEAVARAGQQQPLAPAVPVRDTTRPSRMRPPPFQPCQYGTPHPRAACGHHPSSCASTAFHVWTTDQQRVTTIHDVTGARGLYDRAIVNQPSKRGAPAVPVRDYWSVLVRKFVIWQSVNLLSLCIPPS